MRFQSRYIRFVLFFLVLLEPTYFGRIMILDRIFLLGKFICGAYVFVSIFRSTKSSKTSKLRIKKSSIPFVVMFSYMLLNTVVHGTITASTIESLGTAVVLTIIVAQNIDSHRKEIVHALSIVTAIYMTANFATIMLFPRGLYSTYSLYENEYVCWLLGYKNPIGRFTLLTLGINLCYSYLTREKLDWKQYLLGVIGVWTVIAVDSATTLVAIFVLYLFVLFFDKIQIPRWCNLFNVFLAGGLLTIGIYAFRLQEMFSYLIVKILKRNLSLTSRIYIWKRTIEFLKSSPILGHGILPASKSYLMIKASHPHNFYFYQLYTGGVVGLILVSIMIFSVSGAVKKQMKNKLTKICFFALSAIMIMGITESLTQMPLLYPFFMMTYHFALKPEIGMKEQTSDLRKNRLIAS